MSTVLITGANRGLGLEFCQQYASAGWSVIACCRDPHTAVALKTLAEQYSQLAVHGLDVSDLDQINDLAVQLQDIKLDVLINNAGVYGDTSGQGFGRLDYDNWTQTLSINVLAPVKMAEAFLPHLQKGEQQIVVAISSLMGSIADNTSGGSIIYRSSKAALNAAMTSVALDIKALGIGVLILHPGWVKTDMGGSNAPIAAPESVSGMRQVIADFKLEQTGAFVKYDGKPLPW